MAIDKQGRQTHMSEGIISLVAHAIEEKRLMSEEQGTFDREFGGISFDILANEMINDAFLVDNIKELINNSFKYNLEKQYPKSGEELWKMNANT